MSQFEFVSVAVALLYAVAVGRLLSALPDVFERGRRYWVHAGWVVYLLLFSALSWWNFFANARDLEFDPITFLLALSIPALVIVRAQLLVGQSADPIASYRARYYEKRISFFAVGLASMTLLQLLPWLIGTVSFGEISPAQVQGAPFLLIWIVGILSARHAIHVGLISIMLPLSAGLFLADAFVGQ